MDILQTRKQKKLASKLPYSSKLVAASLAKDAGKFFSMEPSFINKTKVVKRPLECKVLNGLSADDKSRPVKKLKMDSPDGYVNLGNTCYLNAVLQSLLSLRCFAIDIVQSNFQSSFNGRCLFLVLFLLIKCKYNGDSLKNQVVLIREIRSLICKRANKFVGFNEQDAHELLSYCLEILRMDIMHIKGLSLCPVEINFKSCIEQTLSCTKCHHMVRSHEDVYFLSLHFTKSGYTSVQDLLEDYFKTEIVEYNCINCDNKSFRLSRQFSLLARVLILTLKRYTINDLGIYDKNQEPVRIPRFINVKPMSNSNVQFPSPHNDSQDILGPLMGLVETGETNLSPEKTTSLNFRLTSIISHIGKSSSSGHYVSEVYCPLNNVWWHCNDSVITRTTAEYVRQIHQTKAYILFYIHH